MIEVVKYIVEGLTVALASHLVSGGRLDIKEIVILGVTAAAVFMVLEMFSPSVAVGARQGAGFGIGYGLVNEGHQSYMQQGGQSENVDHMGEQAEQYVSTNIPYKLVDGQYSAKILLAGFNENARGYNHENNAHAHWPFGLDATGGQRGGATITDTLNNGETLAQDSSLQSKNGQYTLTMQSDGNLVLYDNKHVAAWSTGTYGKGKGPYRLVMQKENNLVLYDSTNTPQWYTTTATTPGSAKLVLQDDRNVCVYNNGTATWCSMSQVKASEVAATPAVVVGQPPTAPAPMAQTAPAPMAQTAPAPMAQTAPAPMAQTAPAPMAQTAPVSSEHAVMAEMAPRRMMPPPHSDNRASKSNDNIMHDKNYRAADVLYSGDIVDITSGDGKSYLQRGTVDSQIVFEAPLPKVGTNLSKVRIVHPKHKADRQTVLKYGESVYIMHNAYFNNSNLSKFIKHGDRLQSHQEGSLFRAFKIYDATDKNRTGPVEVGKAILIARGDQEGENVYAKIEADKSVSSKSPLSEASHFIIKLRRVYETGNRNLCVCPKETLYP